MKTELVEFIREALSKGISRQQIADVLTKAGWSEADISTASGAFASVEFPIPVPRPVPYLSARDVFIYALFFSMLYTCVYNLGSLIFNYIDLAYPDPASGLDVAQLNSGIFDAIRWNASALIVAFPIFLYLFRSLDTAIAKDPTKHESRPRKWLTYLTLFLAACAIVGDLSTLVYRALGGELTVRFILKVATVAVIAGGTFSYFLIDIRRGERP